MKQKFKKMAKERRGVTLIALVITIIVLLILAGVTIAMLTGDNGIISKAMQAKNKTEEARKTEEAGLKKIENYINGKSAEAGVGIQDLKSIKSDGTEGEVIGEKVSDGAEGVVPVPNGFYYVGGTVKSGAVISDNLADKDKYKGQEVVGTDLSGNQFVFIPVNGEDLKYEQDHTYDGKHEYAYTSALSGWTDVSDSWSDDSGEQASVKNYGGFFIGRYEAGYPDEIKEGTIVNFKNSATEKVPVSKAGVAAWNLVDQEIAKAASESMYNTADSKVKSKLVDSYAWDTTCK